MEELSGGRGERFFAAGDGGKAEMLPADRFAGEHVAGEIEFMQALHDDDLYAGGGIIDAAAERGIKADIDGFTLKLADGLLGIEGIVKDQDVAAEAGGGGLHAGGKHDAAPGVLKMALEILVFGKCKQPAPVLLIPVGFNHAAAKDAVLGAELFRIGDEHEAPRRIVSPEPDGKEDGDEQALHGARRHVE